MFDEKHREVFKDVITACVRKSHHNPFNRVSESIPPS